MARKKQLGFEFLENKGAKYFGGAYLKNSNPKLKRPITTQRSMHLVLRSSMARGELSLLKKQRAIDKILTAQAKRFGVKIYKQANGGNHLHLIVLPRSRKGFQGFLRSVTGLVARLILGVERGRAKGLRFWDQRPFTRVIEWGRDFGQVSAYLIQNTLEALGFIPYQPRKYKLRPAPS